MGKTVMAAAVVLWLAMPTGSVAQSSDAQYCAALRDTYTKYVMSRGSRGARQGIPANIGTAMSKCDTSDVAWAITQLEQALRNAKFNLPARG